MLSDLFLDPKFEEIKAEETVRVRERGQWKELPVKSTHRFHVDGQVIAIRHSNNERRKELETFLELCRHHQVDVTHLRGDVRGKNIFWVDASDNETLLSLEEYLNQFRIIVSHDDHSEWAEEVFDRQEARNMSGWAL